MVRKNKVVSMLGIIEEWIFVFLISNVDIS